MKVKIILFFFLFSFNWLSAQKTIKNSFVILDNTSNYTNEFITSCILKANFETYRLKEQKVMLSCNNGAIRFELLSAKELFIKDPTIDVLSYSETVSAQAPSLILHDNGYFTQKITIANQKYKSTGK